MELYIVQNREGKYFRSKGYGGYGETWVEEIDKAKVYQKLRQARGRVSFFAKNYPKYGVPIILKLIVDRMEVIDERERVEKALQEKKEKLKRAEIQQKKRELEQAKKNLKEAEQRLKKLSNSELNSGWKQGYSNTDSMR